MRLLLLILLLANLSFAQTDRWRLIWDTNEDDTSATALWKYRVFRGTSTNPTTQIDSVLHVPRDGSDTTTQYIDSSLTRGINYYYRVTAVDSDTVSSDYSDNVYAAIPDVNETQRRYRSSKQQTINYSLLITDPDSDNDSLTVVLGDCTNVAVDTSLFQFLVTGGRGQGWFILNVVDQDSFWDMDTCWFYFYNTLINPGGNGKVGSGGSGKCY